MGKSFPDPTPPKETAAASTSTNVSTAIANAYMGNVNQYTPDGSLEYTKTGSESVYDPYTDKTYDIPRWSATQTLSPQAQATQDSTNAAKQNFADVAAMQSGRLKDTLSTPMTAEGLPSVYNPRLYEYIDTASAGPVRRSYSTDFSQDRQKVEDALMARLNPQLERDQAALDTKLANQGIGVGSRAFSDAYSDFGQNRNDARLAAILSAGQEQSRLVGLESQRAQFENAAQAQQFGQNTAAVQFANDSRLKQFSMDQAARNQGLQEQFAIRNQPINEISALLSGSQVSQPNFVNAQMPTIPTTDTAGIIGQYDQARMQKAQAENAVGMNILGGLFGLGGNMILASDRRLKTDIKRIGTADNGLPIYSYKYVWGGGTQIGFMADEVKEIHPEAVSEIGGGFLGVDYEKAVD